MRRVPPPFHPTTWACRECWIVWPTQPLQEYRVHSKSHEPVLSLIVRAHPLFDWSNLCVEALLRSWDPEPFRHYWTSGKACVFLKSRSHLLFWVMDSMSTPAGVTHHAFLWTITVRLRAIVEPIWEAVFVFLVGYGNHVELDYAWLNGQRKLWLNLCVISL